MLRLNLNTRPAWIDLGFGVEVEVIPITTAVITAASAAPGVTGLAADAGLDERYAALTRAIAQIAICAWRGVGNEDDQPIDPTPEAIGALMDLYQINRAFGEAYVARGLLVTQEKKG